MEINFLAVFAAAASTLVVGFIWYNPNVFGGIWMRETGMTEERARQANMFKMLAATFVYALLISLLLMPLMPLSWQTMALPTALLNTVRFMAAWWDCSWPCQ